MHFQRPGTHKIYILPRPLHLSREGSQVSKRSFNEGKKGFANTPSKPLILKQTRKKTKTFPPIPKRNTGAITVDQNNKQI